MVRRDLIGVAFQRLQDCHTGTDKQLRVHREAFGLAEFRCNLNLFELPYRSLIKDQIQLRMRSAWYTKVRQQEVVRQSELFVAVT